MIKTTLGPRALAGKSDTSIAPVVDYRLLPPAIGRDAVVRFSRVAGVADRRGEVTSSRPRRCVGGTRQRHR